MKIRILITGGTFDKEYNELNGELYFRETHVPAMLELARSRLKVEVETLMLVDSLDVTQRDRELMIEACTRSEQSKIVITHGTDTMAETAKVLASAVSDKTIVLMGAMIPYKFGSSDGLFNLGCALAFAQTLPRGVYIAMNGKYYHWYNVRKNRELGLFEELS
ncbi:MAG: asparaginase domain-containing protein [Bacteroidia bacterium]